MGKGLAAAINKKHATEALTRSLLLARRGESRRTFTRLVR